MNFPRRSPAVVCAALLATAVPSLAGAQTLPPINARDSVTLRASDKYNKGGLHRFFFGDNYRDIWNTPVKVPVLDLADFAGGLTPTETGGGMQTRALRFMGANGREYSFRPVYKALLDLPDSFRGTIIWNLVMDARSASHPTAPVSAVPIVAAAGLLQAPAALVAMPDDPRLGQFRQEFAGILGTIEERPKVPDNNPSAAFAGAENIEDGADMLERINEEPEKINTRAFLKAVLVDALLNDNDRHAGQWSWARLEEGGVWQPIPRDRDKVFIDYEGFLVGVGRGAAPTLVRFDATYPRLSDLFDNAVEFERRMLNGVEKPVWDSVVRELKAEITDQVLEAAVAAQPREYDATNREILATMKARRDNLQSAADKYYAYMAQVVDLHATDESEIATVERTDGGVTINIREADKEEPWYTRRFNNGETREIRVYLHGGDDVATVTGSPASGSIRVRLIGGNGTNRLENQAQGSTRRLTNIYDNGVVTGIRYELDTTSTDENDEAALPYNRRPLVRVYGQEIEATRDRGTRTGPMFGVRTGHGLGFTPKITISRTKYGFRKVPYASTQSLDFAYSTGLKGFELGFETDHRFESTGFHVASETRMSQISVADFRGFGNDALDELPSGTPEPDSRFYRVTQSQYLFNPSLGYTFGRRSDVSVGPIVKYTVADSTASRFISVAQPYGFRKFGQAGMQVRLTHDTRMAADTGRNRGGVNFTGAVTPPLWGKLEVTGSVFPATWDVEETYESVEAVATAYLTFPVLTKPVLALRAGGQKLFGGDFPWFDAAFIGGSGSLRTEQRQRYAGDASAYGSAELRLPIAKFPLIFPLDVGVLGFADMARVYLDGESPGGWHRGMGGGLWIGVVNPGTNVNIIATDNPDRRYLVSLGFAF